MARRKNSTTMPTPATSKAKPDAANAQATASGNSFRDNPYFDNPERASYELAYLLRDLPRYPSEIDPGDHVARLKVAATVQHARAARDTLVFGMEAIGSCLFVVGTNEDYRVENNRLANLGDFISHIAQLIQLTNEVIEQLGDTAKGGTQ